MNYRAFIRTLDARGMFRIRPGLAHIRRVLEALGNPQNRYPAIHIAGTNGKGSVAAALESVLRASGYSTGMYTSPHLVDLRERIVVDGKPFVRGFTAIAEQVLKAEKKTNTTLTYFELLTAIAFHTFALKKVDIAIVECGLGGFWDATNVIQNPLFSVITSIGLDHMKYLGRTEYQIASQKAGIIKKGGCVISGVRGKGRAAIQKKAFQLQAKLIQVDLDFRATPLTTSWRTGLQVISYEDRTSGRHIVPFGLLGRHQVDNAAVTMAALSVLKDVGYRFATEGRDIGLRNIHWPGRLQLLRTERAAPILLDGAHNPSAMAKLLESIALSPFRSAPKTFVVSFFKDKNYQAMAAMIAPLASEVCLAALPKPRGTGLRSLKEAFRRVKGPVRQFAEPSAALEAARRDTPKDGVIIVTGSLFLVGQILKRVSTAAGPSLLHV